MHAGQAMERGNRRLGGQAAVACVDVCETQYRGGGTKADVLMLPAYTNTGRQLLAAVFGNAATACRHYRGQALAAEQHRVVQERLS
jgi:hypothetical protein